jgi:adenine-specific DNA-methyltransferase
VVFHDGAAIELKPHVKKNSVAVELTDFSVFYSQDSIAAAGSSLKDKASKIVVEKGRIVKVSKDAKDRETRGAHKKVDRLDRLLVCGFQLREQARDR